MSEVMEAESHCPLTTSLSDEVLLLIVQNLDLVDVINLSQTCQKLNNLLKDKTICEELRFHWHFRIGRLDFVKFLRNSDRSALITKLNINDFYWVPSGIIRNIVRPLINLQEFHAAGTQLSWTHLTEILTPAKNLHALSWSWDHRLESSSSSSSKSFKFLEISTKSSMTNMGDLENMKSCLQNLKFLLLHIPTVHNFTAPTYAAHPGMSYFISSCSSLEHLWILAWPKTDAERKLMEIFGEDNFPSVLKLTKLRTFSVRVMEAPRMYAPKLINTVIANIGESNEENPSQLEHLWLDHPLLSGSPWSRIAYNRLRGTAGHLYPWPKLNLNHIQTLSLPLTDGAVQWWEGNSYTNVRHLQITDGLPNVKNLSTLFDSAVNLETVLVKAFNVKLDWNRFVELHPKLTEISVCQDGDFPYPEIAIALTKLKNLKKLSLPLYSLLGIRNSSVVDKYRASLDLDVDDEVTPGVFPNKTLVAKFEDSLFGKKVRISMASKSKDPNLVISGVDLITQSCRKIEEFELGFSSKTRPGFMVMKSLSTLCKWKHLKKLTLEGAPVHDGKFLIDVAKSCRVESLSLRYLGTRAKCNYVEDLCTAFKYFTCLRDFRFEQNYIGSTARLLTSLSHCKLLRRFLLWSNSNDHGLDHQSCLKLMDSCPELQMLYITIGATTKIMCETIRKNIESKYKRSRPGLHVVIRRGTTDIHEDEITLPPIYPSVHYREMVVFAPKICQQNDFEVLWR